MTALSTLSATFTETVNIAGSRAVAGSPSGISGSGNDNQLTQTLGTGIANASPGGADEAYSLLLSVVNGTPAVIDLSSFTDITGQTGISLARVKAWRFRLLSATQAAADGTVGNACSGITVGGGSTPFGFGLSTASVTFPVDNGGKQENICGGGAGIAVTTNVHITITNGDAVNTAQVLVTLVGGTT